MVSLETGVSRVGGRETFTVLTAPLEGGEFVFLRVADTGAGMDEPTLNRIFDPSYDENCRGGASGSRQFQGIVRGHGGAISVTSKVGEGSVFTVYLPSSDPSLRAPSRRVQAATPKPQGSTRTVLAIDDRAAHPRYDPAAAPSSRDTTCYDGHERRRRGARSCFGRSRPVSKAVLLDAHVYQVFRADEILAARWRKRSDVKVVLAERRRRARKSSLGFCSAAIAAFLQKPFTIDQLNEGLKRVLPR